MARLKCEPALAGSHNMPAGLGLKPSGLWRGVPFKDWPLLGSIVQVAPQAYQTKLASS